MAVDDYAVYSTTNGGAGVRATLLDGGASQTLVPTSDALSAITADGHAIYWVDSSSGEIYKLPLR